MPNDDPQWDHQFGVGTGLAPVLVPDEIRGASHPLWPKVKWIGLKGELDKDLVVMGSGELVQSLMRRNLVDSYMLLIHPLVLASECRDLEHLCYTT